MKRSTATQEGRKQFLEAAKALNYTGPKLAALYGVKTVAELPDLTYGEFLDKMNKQGE